MIKTIIFDLGNVLIPIHLQSTIEHFVNLNVADFSSIFTFQKQHDILTNFEVGQCDKAMFRQQCCQFFDVELDDNRFDLAFCAMIGEMSIATIMLLQQLSYHYTIYLCSNTNAIHIDYLNNLLQQQHDLKAINDLFTKSYLSYEVGQRKPDSGLFHMMLDENNLIAQETLFIDDNDANIAAAQALNIQTLQYHIAQSKLATAIAKFLA